MRKSQFIVYYIRRNNGLILLCSFFIISVLCKAFFQIDFTIPCVFKLITHKECLGCGLTTAFVHFVKGEWFQAWNSNKLFLPIGFLFLYLAFRNFKETKAEYLVLKK